jgi:tetrahydromethanopterin S-methyltransferase subunit G
MEANFQQFPASGHLVDDITHLRQRLEYIERHVQTRNQEVKNEYNQALTKVLEAEEALRNFKEVFNNSK